MKDLCLLTHEVKPQPQKPRLWLHSLTKVIMKIATATQEVTIIQRQVEGENYWIVYGADSYQKQVFASEAEVRYWLEQNRYHTP